MRFKRLGAAVLSAVMMLTAVATPLGDKLPFIGDSSAIIAGAETYGLYYRILDNGTVEITGYDGSAEYVFIPSEINGEPVTSIGDQVFYNCANLKSVIIPEGVTSIGYWAFLDCTDLTSITIPDSVTEIGGSAFGNCTSLTSITIPESVTNIEYMTFYNCTSLTSVMIPDSVTSIGDYAFLDCTSLTNITIPDSVTEIGWSAFQGCTSLTSITIPDSVTSIGSSVLSNCQSLTSVTVDPANKYYYSRNGILFSRKDKTLVCYPGGKKDSSYTTPSEISKIDEEAFLSNSYIKKVTVADNVKYIGERAFKDCINLASISITDNIEEISKQAFDNTKFYNSQSAPVKYIGKWVIGCDKEAKNVTVKKGTVNIVYGAFEFCNNLRTVSLPESLKSIQGEAFSCCTNLQTISLPEGLENILFEAFFGCTSLTSITIPKSVKNIGEKAFGYYYDVEALESKKINNFKIYCYSGTEGEQYAKDNGFTYELLDKPTLSKVTGAKLGGRAADALRINWTKNASADGYIVEMYQNGKWARVGKITNNSTTTFRKAGLKASTVYKFRVKAYKMCGTTAFYSAYSATVAARTNPSVITGTKLTGRAADALRINWAKNASADGYIVEMYQGNNWTRVSKITNYSTTTFRKAGLKASTVYKFRVRAYKMSGSAALYGNYSAVVTARTNPSVMKDVKIGGTAKDALRVNWTKNASAQGYIVEMYKGGKWVRVAKITNSNTTTFRKAGLAKNTTYKFRVKAYYMSGKTALYGGYGSVSGKTAAK